MAKLTPLQMAESAEVCEKLEQMVMLFVEYIWHESASQPWNIVSIQIFADIYRKAVSLLEEIQEIRGSLTDEIAKAVLP